MEHRFRVTTNDGNEAHDFDYANDCKKIAFKFALQMAEKYHVVLTDRQRAIKLYDNAKHRDNEAHLQNFNLMAINPNMKGGN